METLASENILYSGVQAYYWVDMSSANELPLQPSSLSSLEGPAHLQTNAKMVFQTNPLYLSRLRLKTVVRESRNFELARMKKE